MLEHIKIKLNAKDWNFMYKLAKKYYEHNNDLEVPHLFKTLNGYENTNIKESYYLGNWVVEQRRLYSNGKLSQDKIKLLKDIGIRFEVKDYEAKWQEMYNLAKAYKEHYGNVEIVCSFKTVNGYKYNDGEGSKNLGAWVAEQRRRYNQGKLNTNRVELLNSIGFRFEVRDNEKQWEKMYELAKKYYDHQGNLNIPQGFKTINGYDYNDSIDCYNLSSWLNNQKTFYKNGKLSNDRIKKLEAIGATLEAKDQDKAWQEMYNLAQNYYKKNKNLEVVYSFKTKDGITYDNSIGSYALGRWLTTQRNAYKNGKLPNDRIKKLEEIGFRFTKKTPQEQWNNAYLLAKDYYDANGNLDIDEKYKTKDGFELGSWLTTQRNVYKRGKLSPEKTKKLEEIGISFANKLSEENWLNAYTLAKTYYTNKGNLNIIKEYKTEDGFELGVWLANQKAKYRQGKLKEEYVHKLEDIGIKWYTKPSVKEKAEFCNYYNINYDKVYNISYIELYAKTKFLLASGYKIEQKGVLNPIYTIKDEDIPKIYGITLDEIIATYGVIKKEDIRTKRHQ